MAKPPPKTPGDQDRRITDLRRYRKEREQALKRKPNPNAGLILVVLAVAVLAYLFLPVLMARFR